MDPLGQLHPCAACQRALPNPPALSTLWPEASERRLFRGSRSPRVISKTKHYCSISKHRVNDHILWNGTCGSQSKGKMTWIQEMDKGKIQYLQQSCLGNCHNMDADELCWGPLLQKSEPRGLRLSGKGTKQDYLWHLAMTSPLHATKRVCPFSQVWLSAISPSYFLFLSFQILSHTFFIAFLMLYYTDWEISECILLPSIVEQ